MVADLVKCTLVIGHVLFIGVGALMAPDPGKALRGVQLFLVLRGAANDAGLDCHLRFAQQRRRLDFPLLDVGLDVLDVGVLDDTRVDFFKAQDFHRDLKKVSEIIRRACCWRWRYRFYQPTPTFSTGVSSINALVGLAVDHIGVNGTVQLPGLGQFLPWPPGHCPIDERRGLTVDNFPGPPGI